MEWQCMKCGFKNNSREPTMKELEKSKKAIEMNPYSKYLPKGLNDVWCDNCKAHNTLVNNKSVLCSGGKIFYKKYWGETEQLNVHNR